MAKMLVHIHSGPEDPNKVTLACLVAATAAKEGHDVTVFMAGDAVHLMDPQTIASLEGLGTGKLSDHIPAIAAHGGKFKVSGMSAKARGFTESIVQGHPAEFAMPDVLVALATDADTVLCY